MNAARWWWIAYVMAALGPVLVLGTLWANLTLEPPLELAALSASPEATYVSSVSEMGPEVVLLSVLPVVGLLLGWTSLVAALLAWRYRPAQRLELTVGFCLVWWPTLLLRLVWSA